VNYLSRREVLRGLLSASIVGILPASGRERQNFEPVRDRILQAIANGRATGVAVAVAYQGRIVWEEGFGWANRETGVKVTPRTPFSLASITKPFTTTTVMTLVAEGKVSLDEPANKYLSRSKIEGANGNADGATVQRLGAHASGLPTMFETYQDRHAQSPDTLLRDYGRLAYPPGSCYEYSNIGFAALGEIASNLTDTELGTLMTQRVLAPLGLNDSFFDTNIARLPTGAVRYDDSGNPIPYYTTSTPASGELYSSAHDLARFAMFNMKNLGDARTRILDERWIDELHKPVFIGRSGVSTTFGWFLAHLKSGVPVILKNGGQPGVATVLYMIPSENLACLVLTNRSDGRELAHSVCDQILVSYLPEWIAPEENAELPPSRFLVTREFGGRWAGTLMDGGARMRVRLEIESSDSATFALDEKPAEKITEMQSEGMGFIGTSTGLIESADAIRNQARTLKIKLIPHEGKLVGRVIAEGGKAGSLPSVMLPYVLSLNRVAG
jgi:CubicO group peptidase (beta-lactamase class C family)